MSKSINVELDEDMVEVVEKIHPCHRNTSINLGLKLLSETDLYKTFFTKESSRDSTEVEESTSLLDLGSSTTSTKEAPKEEVVEQIKPKVDWDNF